eukprot:1664457-Prymnesium_polylepis.1
MPPTCNTAHALRMASNTLMFGLVATCQAPQPRPRSRAAPLPPCLRGALRLYVRRRRRRLLTPYAKSELRLAAEGEAASGGGDEKLGSNLNQYNSRLGADEGGKDLRICDVSWLRRLALPLSA